MSENKPTTVPSVDDVVHTPGPWKQFAPRIDDNIERDYRSILGGDGLRGRGFEIIGFISEADARLIAAAPDLLLACKLALYSLRCGGISGRSPETDTIEAAIEKATGKPDVMDDDEDKCECHERDSSYVCKYCYERGERGHMQR